MIKAGAKQNKEQEEKRITQHTQGRGRGPCVTSPKMTRGATKTNAAFNLTWQMVINGWQDKAPATSANGPDPKSSSVRKELFTTSSQPASLSLSLSLPWTSWTSAMAVEESTHRHTHTPGSNTVRTLMVNSSIRLLQGINQQDAGCRRERERERENKEGTKRKEHLLKLLLMNTRRCNCFAWWLRTGERERMRMRMKEEKFFGGQRERERERESEWTFAETSGLVRQVQMSSDEKITSKLVRK